MERYECKTAQKGFAIGKAFLICAHPEAEYHQKDPGSEAERLMNAAAELERKMSAQKEQAKTDVAALIDAQILILKEDDFLGEMIRLIREEHLSAREAIGETVEKLCSLLGGSGDDYIRERSDDLRGLGKGLNTLITGNRFIPPAERVIVVGKELSPSDITLIGKEHICGILSEKGSPTSHVSVLAGCFDVPYLYGFENITDSIRNGDPLIIDGETGSVYVNPHAQKMKEAEAFLKEMERICRDRQTAYTGLKTATRICANISSGEEAEAAVRKGADGIGLFRTEFLFLNREEAPSEEEQYKVYRHVVQTAKEAVIRTMDLGSDKKADWLKLPEELNPALGLRGIRVSLAQRGLFRTQLRALLRAAKHGKLRIMIPMLTSLWELEETKEEIRRAAEELEERKEEYRIPELGVMIETPAAVMIAEELAEKADFFSIGTNDLTEYTLAVDRECEGLDDYYDPVHDAVIRMIDLTIKAAHAGSIPVSVCGELAGDPDALKLLLRLGADELSVSVGKLLPVRKAAAEAEKSKR